MSEERIKLLPPERIALTAARSMIRRGDNPEINVTAVLALTVERLAGLQDDTTALSVPDQLESTRFLGPDPKTRA